MPLHDVLFVTALQAGEAGCGRGRPVLASGSGPVPRISLWAPSAHRSLHPLTARAHAAPRCRWARGSQAVSDLRGAFSRPLVHGVNRECLGRPVQPELHPGREPWCPNAGPVRQESLHWRGWLVAPQTLTTVAACSMKMWSPNGSLSTKSPGASVRRWGCRAISCCSRLLGKVSSVQMYTAPGEPQGPGPLEMSPQGTTGPCSLLPLSAPPSTGLSPQVTLSGPQTAPAAETPGHRREP